MSRASELIGDFGECLQKSCPVSVSNLSPGSHWRQSITQSPAGIYDITVCWITSKCSVEKKNVVLNCYFRERQQEAYNGFERNRMATTKWNKNLTMSEGIQTGSIHLHPNSTISQICLITFPSFLFPFPSLLPLPSGPSPPFLLLLCFFIGGCLFADCRRCLGCSCSFF